MQNTSATQQGSVSPDQAHLRVRDGAKALVSTERGILLVKERHADGSPFWTLPGGGVDGEESAVHGLQRELEEELRTTAQVRDPVTTFVYKHRSRPNTVSRYTVFKCSLSSEPRPNPREGIIGHRWVQPSNPPATTLPQVQIALVRVADD